MKKKSVCMFILAGAMVLTSCQGGRKQGNQDSSKETAEVSRKQRVENTGYQFLKDQAFSASLEAYEPLEIDPQVPEYQVEKNLSNVVNLSQFGNLNDAQIEKLEKNGFVVSPTDSEQLFYVYEDNAYKRLPSFITTDSVLQLYHIFYDYTLREVEAGALLTDVMDLNANMMEKLTRWYEELDQGRARDCTGKVLAYFGVGACLLGEDLPKSFPQELIPLVDDELDLIEAKKVERSSITGSRTDYSLFTVRGHYTRSQDLTDYFNVMSLYGVLPFAFYQDGKKNEEGAAMTVILCSALGSLEPEYGMNLWENIYTITGFFVGTSDDLGPWELIQAIKKTYGKLPMPQEVDENLEAFYQEVDTLDEARIVSTADEDPGPQFRFMGQRYLPDSEIFSRLTAPIIRPIPTGLDVMGVLGSERAEELLDEIYEPAKAWREYPEEYQKLKTQFSSMSLEEKTVNLYHTWLYTLGGLNQSFGKGYPAFMQNTAWEDKSLCTALGSWSELRHDTILYGKQSTAECGGGEPPEVEKLGYVEPNPEFYNRLLWLTKQTQEGLAERGAISEAMAYKCEDMVELLSFLKTCSIKELQNEELSEEEYASLFFYGGQLEYISSSFANVHDWYNITSDTDRNMAVIADIHSATTEQGNVYLEVGVGSAAEIYAVVPMGGKLYLARGAVFDYFEFTNQKRLTDEEWQKMIPDQLPERPPFIGSFFINEMGEEVPIPEEPYSTGC